MNGGLEYPRIAEIGTAKPLPLMTLITVMSADLGERWESSEHRVIEWPKGLITKSVEISAIRGKDSELHLLLKCSAKIFFSESA